MRADRLSCRGRRPTHTPGKAPQTPTLLESVDDAGAAADTTWPVKNRKTRMRKPQGATASIICAVLCLYTTFAQAGPCSEDIAQFEAAMRQSAGNPYAGLSAPQSVGAQLEHQPTRQSVKQSQLHLRAKFSAAMARAKLLDSRGDGIGCNRALSAAKRMYIF
jgi:hypothetical protein